MMKNILFLITFISMSGLYAQTGYVISGSNSITTAEILYFPNNLYTLPTVWYIIDTLNVGVDTCVHNWYHNEPESYSGGFGRSFTISCAVMHPPGTRCSWTIQTRKSICSKCFRHIVEQDEDPNPKPKPDPIIIETYETIVERLNKKNDN